MRSSVISWPALALALVSFGCSDEGLIKLEPALALSPSSVNFGPVPVGTEAIAEVLVLNPGQARLTDLLAEPSEGLAVDALPTSIGAGQVVSATLRFAATAAGPSAGEFAVRGGDGLRATLTWTATGAVPDIVVTPEQLPFGQVLPGEERAQVFVILNSGQAPLTVSDLALAGDDAAEFEVAGLNRQPPFVLAPEASEVVEVRFAPDDLQAAAAVVTVRSDDPDRPQVPVALAGNEGPANSPPAIRILTPNDGDDVSVGQVYPVRAVALDVESAPPELEVELISSVQGLLGSLAPDVTGQVVFEVTGTQEGPETLSAVVRDPEGAGSVDDVDLNVLACAELSWYRDESFDANFDTSLFVLNGDAVHDPVAEELVLTDLVQWSAGALYLADPLLVERFVMSVTFRIDPGTGADGLAIAWATGAPPADLLGSPGEAMGIGDLASSSGWVVEVDVYTNWERADPAADHVALVSLPDYQHVGDPVEVPELETGDSHVLEVDFELGVLEVSLDGASVLSTVIAGYVPFEGYLGLTAATGNDTNRHVIEHWTVQTGCW